MSAILDAIGDMIADVVSWVTSTITSISSVFYTAADGFTFVGTLLLVAFGLGMVWVVIKFINKLVRRG